LTKGGILTNNRSNNSQWGYDALRRAIDAAGVSLWSWNVNTDAFRMDARGCDLWEQPHDDFVTFEDLSEKIHPADRDRVKSAFHATRTIEGVYEIDFRTLVGAEVRGISSRGQGEDVGKVNGIVPESLST
jgi:hypothetical protein